MYSKTCILCQRTSLKRWFGNRTMTSNCDVTNSAQQIQMTTLCHWMKPPWKFSAYATGLNPARPEKPDPTYNSALRLPRWRLLVMPLWRLNVYGAIMATLLFDATTILKSFWCSTMQSYQKLSTKVLSTLAGPALRRCSCIGPRASGGPAPWCLSRLFIFSRYRLRSITQQKQLINLIVKQRTLSLEIAMNFLYLSKVSKRGQFSC